LRQTARPLADGCWWNCESHEVENGPAVTAALTMTFREDIDGFACVMGVWKNAGASVGALTGAEGRAKDRAECPAMRDARDATDPREDATYCML